MAKLASWIRRKDVRNFRRVFAPHPQVEFCNAAEGEVDMSEADALLLTGGPDVAEEFLRQPVPDPSVLEDDVDPKRDAWEFEAVEQAMQRGIPILAICKGMQLLNVALGGTLHLDIRGHKGRGMKYNDVQPLRFDRSATLRYELVNSSHHQAVDRIAEGFVVEAWAEADDIIEQMRLTNYPYALAVQYHPERNDAYGALFDEFVQQIR
ncbi:MAG: type 1 glutamine amidotransferase [Chthoniobacterales bacterium]|nr:type 1 glutamine amidotransferase [Chthoniobacterales bacterium]